MIEKPFTKYELSHLWNYELKLDERVYRKWISIIFSWTIRPIAMLFYIISITFIWIYVYGIESIKVLFQKLVKR